MAFYVVHELGNIVDVCNHYDTALEVKQEEETWYEGELFIEERED